MHKSQPGLLHSSTVPHRSASFERSVSESLLLASRSAEPQLQAQLVNSAFCAPSHPPLHQPSLRQPGFTHSLHSPQAPPASNDSPSFSCFFGECVLALLPPRVNYFLVALPTHPPTLPPLPPFPHSSALSSIHTTTLSSLGTPYPSRTPTCTSQPFTSTHTRAYHIPTVHSFEPPYPYTHPTPPHPTTPPASHHGRRRRRTRRSWTEEARELVKHRRRRWVARAGRGLSSSLMYGEWESNVIDDHRALSLTCAAALALTHMSTHSHHEVSRLLKVH